MVWRMTLLILAGLSKHCRFMIEQPVSSVMEFHPSLVFLKKQLDRLCPGTWSMPSTWLGMYGGDCPKPIKIMTNNKGACSLTRKLIRNRFKGAHSKHQLYRKRVDRKGKRVVDGQRGLKGTQAYPIEFGRAVGKVLGKFVS
eukprot:9546305-Alexandrium_andersonii.AAC.1